MTSHINDLDLRAQIALDNTRDYNMDREIEREYQSQDMYNKRLKAAHKLNTEGGELVGTGLPSKKGIERTTLAGSTITVEAKPVGVDCWNRITDESQLDPEVLAILQDDPDAEASETHNELYAQYEGFAITGKSDEAAYMSLAANLSARQSHFNTKPEYDESGKRINGRFCAKQYAKAVKTRDGIKMRELVPEATNQRGDQLLAKRSQLRALKTLVRKDYMARGIYAK